MLFKQPPPPKPHQNNNQDEMSMAELCNTLNGLNNLVPVDYQSVSFEHEKMIDQVKYQDAWSDTDPDNKNI